MNIIITKHPEFRENRHAFVSMYDNLSNIEVRVKATEHKFKRVNATLVLSEFANFLEDLEASDTAIWRVEFEPYRFAVKNRDSVSVFFNHQLTKRDEVWSMENFENVNRSLSEELKKFGRYRRS